MDFFEFSSYIIKTEFSNHQDIKVELLKLFYEADSESSEKKFDLNPFENITKLDWSRSTDTQRKWVKYFFPHLKIKLDEIFKKMGYSQYSLEALWFQQYEKESYHGWHVHGSNFTAVYYVELPEDSPGTEIINPPLNKKIHIDVKEGDVILFPSYVIHRGPPNMSNERKTIISFNTSVSEIQKDTLNKIHLLS